MENKYDEKSLGTVQQSGADYVEINGVRLDWGTLRRLGEAAQGAVVSIQKCVDGVCREATQARAA